MRGRDIAMIISNPRGELDPLLTVGQQIGNVLRYHLGLGRRAIRERVLDMLRAGQHSRSGAARRRLSARTVRRHGAARRHRHRAGLLAALRHLRRRHQRPRRDGAGAGPGADPQPRHRARHVDAVHHPRRRHHRAFLRPRSPCIYAGEIMEIADARRVLRRSAAPLHGAAAGRLLPQRAAAPLLARRGQGRGETARRARSAARSQNRCVRAQRTLPRRAIRRCANASPATSSAVTFRWSGDA